MRTGRRDKYKLNNAGLTLVELVIVIAIMAVLTGSAASLVVSINNNKVKKCAQSIYTALGRVKSNTLAKEKGGESGAYAFEMLRDADNNVVVYEHIGTGAGAVMEKKIASRDVDVQYKLLSDGGFTTLSTTGVKCIFDRSTGGVKTSDFEVIQVKGARISYTITLYPETGKVKMERD